MMRAVVLKKFGKPDVSFEIREVAKPQAQPGTVLVKVEGFGLNYADVMARNGLYRDAPPVPCVLGYEVVGKIEAVGKGVSESRIGERVVALTRFGGYAEYAITDERAAVKIKEDYPFELATALATQYATAYYSAIECANIQPGDKILIHAAAGGVGTALIQLAKMRKCEIIAMCGSDEKLDYLRAQGAHHVINYRKQDYAAEVKRILGNAKLDVCFNSVAGSTFKKDFRLLGAGGRSVLYGAAERSGGKWGIFSTLGLVLRMGRIVPVFLMMNSKSVSGVNMLRIADQKPLVLKRCLEEVVKACEQGILHPVSGGLFTADEISKAHELLESRKSVGKISVKW